MARPYTVVPYSNAWPGYFRAYALRLERVIPGVFDAIHHIGSTSVPGLSAKPIIDVLATVRQIRMADEHESALIAAGYTALGEFGLPGRRYFVLETEAIRHVNLHVFASGHPDVMRHLAFRDYLRERSEKRAEYDRLKRALLEAVPDDLDAYMDGKDVWIRETEQLALLSYEARANARS